MLGWLPPGRTGTHRWGGHLGRHESILARGPPPRALFGLAQAMALYAPRLRQKPHPPFLLYPGMALSRLGGND